MVPRSRYKKENLSRKTKHGLLTKPRYLSLNSCKIKIFMYLFLSMAINSNREEFIVSDVPMFLLFSLYSSRIILFQLVFQNILQLDYCVVLCVAPCVVVLSAVISWSRWPTCSSLDEPSLQTLGNNANIPAGDVDS